MFNKLLGKSVLNVNSFKSNQYLAVFTTSNHITDGGKKNPLGILLEFTRKAMFILFFKHNVQKVVELNV